MMDLPAGMSFDETVKSVSEVERVLLDTKGSPAGVHAQWAPAARCASPSFACYTTRKDERTIKLGGLKADLRCA